MKCAIVVALLLMGGGVLSAQNTERLRTFDNRSRPIYYDDGDIDIQAARFTLPGNASVSDIRITLDGPIGGEARVRLFGSEGGAGAPFYGDDLIQPIIVRKSRVGVETIIARLPQPALIESEQLFIGIDRLSEGTRLLSDSRSRPPRCVGEQDSYSDQLIRTRSGLWRWGKFGYLIEVSIEPEKQPHSALFQELEAEKGVPVGSVSNQLISWGDIDNDGYTDLLAGGHLLKNNRNGSFQDITATTDVIAGSKFHCLLDQDSDGDLDMIVIGASQECSGTECAWLMNNDGSGSFSRSPLDLPGVTDPRCFSIADFNGDGFPDLYIGQVLGPGSTSQAHLLYQSRGGSGFVLDSLPLGPVSGTGISGIGAQFTDFNGDSRSDLFISVQGDSASRMLANSGEGHFLPLSLKLDHASHLVNDAGGSWRDIDSDGKPELLLPRTNWRREPGSDLLPAGSAIISMNPNQEPHPLLESRLARPATRLDMQSGGGWADVNNDGLQDFLLTSSCRCTPVRLYMGTPSGEFRNSTHGSGLWGVSLGPDLAWADFNNDGRVDFCSFSEGRLRVFENVRVEAGSNFVEIDLRDRNGLRAGIGSSVTIHSGAEHYSQEITAGRGKGMQEPERLHFGVGLNQTVDSVIVAWAGDRGTEVFRDLKVNQVNALTSGSFSGRGAVTAISADVSPNPFADKTAISVNLETKLQLQLDIYTSGGSYVATLAQGAFEAGSHQFIWDGKDRSGAIVSQGVYLYRISGGGREVIGKIVRQK